MAPLTDPALARLPGISHGFFSRQGGVSTGLYDGLNCGFGSADDPVAIAENRHRVREELGAKELLTLYQIHSAEAVTVTEGWDPAAAPRADAMVTDRPGIALGALAADCVPILLADGAAKIVGAAHAGWGGALKGVAEATVAAMTALGAEPWRIVAAIGPCIRQDSYEVGPEFLDRFLSADPTNARYFRPAGKPGHHLFDLPGYVAKRLVAAGVGHVGDIGLDTYSDPSRFFSYRRTTHRGEPDYGRQVAAICLGG